MKMGRRQFTQLMAAGALAAERRDVAVIGAGVFGAWSAYLLRRAGHSVVLLDAYGPGNSRASSGGESRIIRMGYGAGEIYTRSSMRSLALWKEFGHDVFHQTGVLWVAPENNPYIESSRRTLEKCGVRFELLNETELEKRYPQMRFTGAMRGIFEPGSGALMARRAVQSVVRETIRLGATYLQQTVTAPAGKGKLSSIGDVRAGTFVFACGPWLPKVFPGLLGGRIQPTRQEVFFFGSAPGDSRFAPPALPVWIDFSDERGAYGFPDLENRGFKIAFDRHGPEFDPDNGKRTITEKGLAEVRKYLGERFPALKDAPLTESRVCQYENTSNGDFLIDRHPDFSNVWLVGGGSGHGFKHGPAVGEYVKNAIEGKIKPEPRFSLATKSREHKRAVY